MWNNGFTDDNLKPFSPLALQAELRAEGLRTEGTAAELEARPGLGRIVALSHCRTAHPRVPRSADIIGAAIFEATMRPNPRRGGSTAAAGRGRLRRRWQQSLLLHQREQWQPV